MTKYIVFYLVTSKSGKEAVAREEIERDSPFEESLDFLDLERRYELRHSFLKSAVITNIIKLPF